MKKLRLIIRINIILLLLITLTVVSRADQIKQETAKAKLEQAIKEVSVEQKTVDASTMKDKIENDVSNSKIINGNTTQYPIYATVDGYKFKVEENGAVENKEDENIKDNQEENNNQTVKNKLLVEYQDDTKTDKGITISTTKDGTITISGKSTEKLFIKISKNIQITENTAEFEEWAKQDRYYNRKREKYNAKSNCFY